PMQATPMTPSLALRASCIVALSGLGYFLYLFHQAAMRLIMLWIQCPKCQSSLPVGDTPANTVMACPRCGAEVRVPPGETAPDPLPLAACVEDAAQPPEPEVANVAISPQDQEVLTELERLQNQRPSWWGGLGVLAISLLLYMGAAQVDKAWDGIFILIP